MKSIPGQTPTRLALFGAVLVGSTLCPPLLAGTAVPAVVANLIGMVASVFGGLVANDMGELAKRLERKDTTNHDLAEATGEAIALVLANLATTQDLDPKLTRKLKPLREVAENRWLEISHSNDHRDTPLALQETELVKLMSCKAEDFARVTALDAETWQNAVRALDAAANTQLPPRWIRLIASQLHRTFPQALREILKADAESGGKAYAAMSLSLMGEMVALAGERQRFPGDAPDDVERLLDILQRSQAEQQTAFRQAMARVESGWTEALERAKQEIIEELRQGFGDVNERLDELVEDVGEIKEIIAEQKPRVGTQTGGNFRGVAANWQGREAEIQQLKAWIFDPDATLMGIEGMGGLGKTSLAAKVFDELKTEYDGYWADVSAGVGFAEVAREVLAQFARPIPEQEMMLADALVACLQDNRCLLVFDNLETVLRNGQFVGGSLYEGFFRGWLNRHSQSAVLVTTRERLDLRGFNRWLPLAGWSEAEGAAFLQERGIQGEERELRAFSALVEGYPLLLRFVADLLLDESPQNPRLERLSALGLASLSELLVHPEVRGTHRQAEVGMVAVLDASYGRLSQAAKTLLHSVSVLAGQFEAEAALAVSGLEMAPTEVAAALRQLARQSWLLEDEVEGRRVYSFQQVVLAYVQHKAGTLGKARRRAIAYYQRQAKPRAEWETLDDVREYLEIFEQFCQLGEYEAAFDTLRDGDNVDRFLNLGGYNSTLVELYLQLVEHWQGGDQRNWMFGAALTNLGNAYHSLGQFQRAIDFHQQSLEMAREIGNRRGEAASLNNLGRAYHSLGQFQRAIDFHQQSLEMAREIGNRRGEAASLNNLGNAYHSLGQFQRAIDFYQQSLEIKREIGDRRGEARSLQNLARAYQQTGRVREGYQAAAQATQILQELDLPLDADPIPKWQKAIVRFAQRGNTQLALCFILGLFAFPFALVGIVLLIVWRWLRRLFRR